MNANSYGLLAMGFLIAALLIGPESIHYALLAAIGAFVCVIFQWKLIWKEYH